MKKPTAKIVKITEIELNNGQVKGLPKNPRFIKDSNFDKLVVSVKEFPEMLDIRPIVVDENMVILGGNMRYRACKVAGMQEIPIIVAENLTIDQKREFLIKDNVSGGDWDWEQITADWGNDPIEKWGLEDLTPEKTETEKLSALKFESIYYEPKIKPDITLADCLDLTKYNAKIKAIDKMKLSKEQKEVLKMFAYRFIKIDFESVANYYYFNAGNEEQKAIERLRLVLVDGGIDGFIEDDLLKIMETIGEWKTL
jgi:ParB/Sulfiredoxin domain